MVRKVRKSKSEGAGHGLTALNRAAPPRLASSSLSATMGSLPEHAHVVTKSAAHAPGPR